MPALTNRMRDDMQVRGLAARTQQSYLATQRPACGAR
ncbi:hypothetical protein BH11GEM1_BH11GEM1_29230 [soil metagenome]